MSKRAYTVHLMNDADMADGTTRCGKDYRKGMGRTAVNENVTCQECLTMLLKQANGMIRDLEADGVALGQALSQERKEREALKDNKPPLGIMPKYLWEENRMWDLIDCLNRHAEAANVPVHTEWMEELRDLLDKKFPKAEKVTA